MLILGIETSCDETSAAIVSSKNNSLNLLSNVVLSSVKLHAKTGGIIPETAAREQIKYILPIIDSAFQESNTNYKDIDAIAVTVGPGLIGSLLVGVETAKTLSHVWNKPLIPINHLFGHIYANWIITNDREQMEKPYAISNKPYPDIEFPALSLVVSGGHTDLVLMRDHEKIKWLGGTRDDAAGEAFDKIGRLLGLPYPAGPVIEQKAKLGNPKAFRFPRPMIDSEDYDFSFSGLKTAVFRETQTIKQLNNETINSLCASIQQAVIDVLAKKTLKAAEKFKVPSILLSGGVAANEKLRENLNISAIRHKLSAKIFVPHKFLCTDNGAMIAAAAFFNQEYKPWNTITANPELYFD